MESVNDMKYVITLTFSLFLFFSMGSVAISATETATSAIIPWSGYWWPTNTGGLGTGIDYNGKPAPLEKYDLLVEGKYPGLATQYYLDHQYDPNAEMWNGLCSAWAAAACSEKIDFFPSVIQNIVYHVGDKKGLISLAHDLDFSINERVGVDAAPELFHYWLLDKIKDQGLSFYGDLDPGEQVWNYPIYKYEMTTTSEGSKLYVTCQIWYADDQVDPDYVGTKPLSNLYYYTLNMSGDEITGGEWTGKSVYDHPQILISPLIRSSLSPYLDYDTVKTIALSKDDELESDAPVQLSPGSYQLILLNSDTYLIPCQKGEQFIIDLQKVDAMAESMAVELKNGLGATVYSNFLSSTLHMAQEASDPPYQLTLSRSAYGDGGFYAMTFDLKPTFEFVNSKVQKGFSWGGFAITNTEDQKADNIYLVAYKTDGTPIQTLRGPFSLESREKFTISMTDFDIRPLDEADFGGVKILSPSPLGVANISGYFGKNMSFLAKSDPGGKWIVPDLSSVSDSSRYISWGIYNAGIQDADLSLTLFSESGQKTDACDIEMKANQVLNYTKSASPFSKSANRGWALIEGGSSTQKGYVEWLNSRLTHCETLPLLKPGYKFYIPNVDANSVWSLKVTVINLYSGENELNLKFVDGGRSDELSISLNGNEKKEIDIANLFSTVFSKKAENRSLVITSSKEMAGYFSYENQLADDDIYFPLMSDQAAGSRLAVPHVAAGNSEWWTGMNLFNPSAETAVVLLLPYDRQNRFMNGYAVELSILGNSRSVFNVSDLFDPVTGDISFIEIEVTSGPDIIGLYGVGNTGFSMASGDILH
jgi:hypothetical protein